MREELRRGAEVAALLGFAVVQPVLDVFGDAPDFLLFRDASRRDVVLLAVMLAVVPLAVLWGIGLMSRSAGERTRLTVHRVTVAGLAAVIAVHALKTTSGLRGAALLLVGAGLAAAFVTVYVRREAVGEWLRYASPAPVVFAALFLLASPASVLVTGGDTAEALAGVEARAPVVMVVFDEFPLQTLLDGEGEIDGRLFPHFAALAGGGTWFRDATAVSGDTPVAVPALLTGRFPPDEPVAPHVAYYPENLFTLLGDAYEVNAVEVVTRLCPTNVCETRRALGGGGLRSLLGDAARTWRAVVALSDSETDPAGEVGVTAGDTDGAGAPARGDVRFNFDFDRLPPAPAAVDDFLARVDGDGRSLHYLHVLLPHVPWQFLPSGERYPAMQVSRGAGPKTHEEEWPHVFDRHRAFLQTVYTDAVLGQIVAHLREVGLYDRALLVVTADHGLNHVPEPGQSWKKVTSESAHQVAWVPLVVKAPGQEEGGVRDDNAMLVDVLPTVADALGVEVPWAVDGRSLFGPARDDDRKPFWNEPGQAEPLEIDVGAARGRLAEGFTDGFVDPAGGEAGLYRVGPFADLVGTEPAEHEVGPPLAADVSVERAELFERVGSAPAVPALVSGWVEGAEIGADQGVAVAVNGTIGGVSATFPLRGHDRFFATMIVPSLLEEGENDLGLYLVEREAGTVVLRELS